MFLPVFVTIAEFGLLTFAGNSVRWGYFVLSLTISLRGLTFEDEYCIG